MLGVTDRSSTPDVPPDLRAPEILPKPMELLENETRAKIYKERTARVREYCKYMKNDSMINDWIEHPGNFLYVHFSKLLFVFKEKQNDADFPMIVDPIHKMLYCELPKVGSSNWKRVLIKLTDPRKRPIYQINYFLIKRKFIFKLWHSL